MKKIIVISPELNKTLELTQKITLIGPGANADLRIPGFPVSMSLMLTPLGAKFIPLDSNNAYRKFSKWGEEVSFNEIWGNEIYKFLIIDDKNASSTASLDWDFKALPKDPKTKDYPKEILNFITNTLQINKAILFKRSHGYLNVLAGQDIKVHDKTSFILNNVIEEDNTAFIYKIKQDTHSVIFNDQELISNFTLVRNKISKDVDIVLYLMNPPEGQNHLPEGILSSLLFLFSHGLSLHLAYQNKSNAFKELEERDVFFWGTDNEMMRNKKMIDRILSTDLSLLILGETGTGKEMIAKYVSLKTGSKLIAVNCASIPKDLAESFFFGHKKGSFTGALSDQMGKIAEANNNILFLDEVGELSLDIQAKLLRVLQEKRFTPVGGKEEKASFKLICATNRSLEDEIKNKTFREDLFYRMNEVSIHLPPLRKRKNDILPLAFYLMRDIEKEYELPITDLSLRSQEFLLSHEWPGNIRELKSTLKKAMLLNEGEMIELSSTKEKTTVGVPVFNLETAKFIFMQEHLLRALAQTKGNKTEAAKLLEIPVRSLFRLIVTYLHDKTDIVNEANH